MAGYGLNIVSSRAQFSRDAGRQHLI